MRVRVGISTRNRRDLLIKALDSVLQQDYPDIEIAVIDDASSDGTSELRQRYPSVIWSRQDTQTGQMHARNRLMAETTAEVYISLDDDAWFIERDEVSRAVALLQAHKNVAVVGYDILSPDQPTPSPRAAPKPFNAFIGCGAVLRLDAVHKAGFYLPVPGIYGSEESDLSIRILDQGRDLVWMPGVHVWHDKVNFARDTPWKHRSGVCNDLVFALRRYPAPQVLWLLPAKILSHLRFALRKNLLKPYFLGLVDFFKASPAVFKSRAPVQAATLNAFNRLGRAN